MLTSLKDFHFNASSWPQLLDTLLVEVFRFGLKMVICIAIYMIGRKIIKYLHKAMGKMMVRREFDPSIASFIRSLVDITLTAMLLLAIVNILGINTTSFVALFASIGVALGMALSGTLQNFAGGVMILLFRPYRIGDYIQAQNQEGTVKEIQIFNTIIVTADNRTIYIPNGGLSTNTIINFNNQKNRRIEWTISTDYGSDYDKTKKVIGEIITADNRILSDPAPFIALKTLNESSVDIVIRAWTLKEDYWDVYFTINEQIYKSFSAHNIDIPFPQLTVHLANK